MQSQQVRIIEEGKLVIPVTMRRELEVATGDTVLVSVADDELRVRSLPAAIARAQAVLRRHVPEGVALGRGCCRLVPRDCGFCKEESSRT